MYGKLFDSIFDSSIMEESIETRYVWQCMIALADGAGNVDMTLAALARRLNVPLSTVSTAVHKLSQPDPSSRSPEAEGRRLIPIDVHREWGWHLVNRDKYADIRSHGGRTDYWREQKRRKRAEKANGGVSTCGQSGPSTASTKVLGKRKSKRKEQLPPEVASGAAEGGSVVDKEPAPVSAKKPPARYLEIGYGVNFLDHYPDLDSPATREALREFLAVAQDDGRALSAAALTKQLQRCKPHGREWTIAALQNSAHKRLAFVGEERTNGNGKHGRTDREVERLRAMLAPGEPGEAVAIDVRARLDALAAAIPAKLPGGRELAAKVRKVPAGDSAAAEAELTELDAALLRLGEDALSPDVETEISGLVAECERRIGGRLTAERRAAYRVTSRQGLIRQRLSLPRLSLFSGPVETTA